MPDFTCGNSADLTDNIDMPKLFHKKIVNKQEP